MKRVEQFVKLQQMPVSTSIFFIWFIILVLEFIPCGSNPSGIAPFDHKGWDICRGTQKIIDFPWNSVVFISIDGGLSLPRKNKTRVRRAVNVRSPLAFAMIRATSEFIPLEAALVIRCLR